MKAVQSAVDCLSKYSFTSTPTCLRMPVNSFCAPSYISSKAATYLIRSAIQSQMFVRPSANVTASEEDSSASYAIVSLMKFRPAVAMSSMNFLVIPPVPMNAVCIFWRRVNTVLENLVSKRHAILIWSSANLRSSTSSPGEVHP